MAVHFVIGRAGTGKTHHCLDAIIGACEEDPLGPPVIYLVPEQASYQAEKALLTHGNLEGITRAQVLSFTRLADYIFARSAAPRTPRMTKAHRRVLVMLLVSRARREDPDGLAGAQGIEDALMDFLAETRQQAIEPSGLREAARALLGAGATSPLTGRLLAGKLERLAGLVERFHDFVQDRFQDPQDTLLQLAGAIGSNEMLQGAQVHVDGFTGFTPVEEKLLVALAKRASTLYLTLPAEPARCERIRRGETLRRHPVFQGTEETFRDLLRLLDQNGVEVAGITATREPRRFRSAGIAAAEARFFSSATAEPTPPDGVLFQESRTTSEEAREAAELAARWLREEDWRPSDIAILTRDLELYADPLAQALSTLKIPFFIDRAQPLASHPMVTGLLALARASLATGPDFSRHLLDFGKSGLPSLPRRDVDHLEYHLMQYPRGRSAWMSERPWRAPPPRSAMEEEDPQAPRDFDDSLEAARRALAREVSEFRQSLDDSGEPEGRLSAFVGAAAASLKRLAGAGSFGEADRRILVRIGELLSIALETAGEEIVPWDMAVELLQRLMGDLTLPRIPPMSGQLLVGQADRSRQPPIRGVIVLGLSEGNFPRIVTNHSLVNDGERDLLADVGLRLRPSGRRQFEREALHAYRAITAASERLALLRPREDKQGNTLTASAFWESLLSIYTEPEIHRAPPMDDPARAWRRRELAGAAVRMIDRSHLAPIAGECRAEKVLLELGTSGEEEALLRAAKWRNKAALDPALAARALRDPVRLSATQLESFAKCPFQHYVRYLLRPGEPMLPRFERRDAGNFFHAVLRNFTALLRDRGLAGRDLDPDAIRPLMDEAREEPARRLAQTGLLDGGHGKYLLARLDAILHDIARWLVESFTLLPLRPVLEETGFGRRDEPLPALELRLEGSDARIQVRGQIDRLDLLATADSNAIPAVVVDYKLKRKKFDFTRWEHGEALQLPIYLLALRDGELGGRKLLPLGAFYLEILPPIKDEENYEARFYDGLIRRSLVEHLFPGANYRRIPPIRSASGDPAKGPTRHGPVVSDEEFDALLDRTLGQLHTLANGITAGHADVAPSRFGTLTACSHCTAREVCGIDYRVNRARQRPVRPQQAVLAALRDGEEG